MPALWRVTTMSPQMVYETGVRKAQVAAAATRAPAQNELNLLELAFSYSAFVPLGSSAYWMVLSILRACLSHLLFCLPMLPRNALRARQKVGFTNALSISQFAQVDSQMSPHRESGGFRYQAFLDASSYSLLCQSSSSLLKPLVRVAI